MTTEIVTVEPVETCHKEEDDHSFLITAAVCLLCGMSHLWFWNSVLNLMNGIQTNIFVDQANVADTLTAVFETSALLGTIIPTIKGALRQANSLGFATLCAAASIGLAFCVQFGSGSKGALAALHICCGLAGFAVGMIESVQFAFATCMPGGVFTGYTSIGQGFCGVVTFCFFMLISRVTQKHNFLNQVWIMMGIGAGLVLISSIVLNMHCQKPQVKQNIKALRQAVREERTDPNAPTWLQLFLDSKLMIFNVFWAFGLTYFIYPNLGPMRWNMSTGGVDLAVGLFQLGDFMGRLIPLLAKWMPWILLNRRALTTLNLTTTIVAVLAVCAWRMPEVVIFRTDGLLCFVLFTLAMFQGWYGTTALIRAPLELTGDKVKYRGRLAAMTIVALLLGISSGLWLSTLIGRTIH